MFPNLIQSLEIWFDKANQALHCPNITHHNESRYIEDKFSANTCARCTCQLEPSLYQLKGEWWLWNKIVNANLREFVLYRDRRKFWVRWSHPTRHQIESRPSNRVDFFRGQLRCTGSDSPKCKKQSFVATVARHLVPSAPHWQCNRLNRKGSDYQPVLHGVWRSNKVKFWPN